MKKSNITFIIFLILIILIFPFSFFQFSLDYASSIIPGWHTTILPFQAIGMILKCIILIFVALGYWKLRKANILIDKKIFFTYLILTIPAIIISNFSLYKLLNPDNENIVQNMRMVYFAQILINAIFFIAQILFGIYYFRLKGKAAANTR